MFIKVLLHEKFGPNDHRKDAFHFTKTFTYSRGKFFTVTTPWSIKLDESVFVLNLFVKVIGCGFISFFFFGGGT